MTLLVHQHVGVNWFRTNSPKKWRAQIIRQSRSLSLGYYETPEEAARAYDNAAYHLREWGTWRGGMRLNFPADWDNPEAIPDPTEKTLMARARLRALFPNWEKKIAERRTMSQAAGIREDARTSFDQIKIGLNSLQPALEFLTGRVEMLESENARLRAEHAVKDRTIEGLQALRSGNIPMRKIVIDTHLESPEKSNS